MKKVFKGKLNLSKEKISRFENGVIKGGGTTGCYSYDCSTASLQQVCGDPNFTRDGGSACKCK